MDWSAILTTDFLSDRTVLFRVRTADLDAQPLGRQEIERALSKFGKVAGVSYRPGDTRGIVRFNGPASTALKSVRNAAGDRGTLVVEGAIEAELEILGNVFSFARPREDEARLWWAVAKTREASMPKVQPLPKVKPDKKKGAKRIRDSDDEDDLEMLVAGFAKAGFAERGSLSAKPRTSVSNRTAKSDDMDGDGKCPDRPPLPQPNSDSLVNTDELLNYFSDPGPGRLKAKKKRFRTKKRRVGDPGGLVTLFGGLGLSNDGSRKATGENGRDDEEGWETEES
jgi:hypothetical protein